MIHPYFNVTGEEAKGLLYGLLAMDMDQVRKHPEWPPVRELVKDGRIKYKEQDPNEHWKTTREMMEEVQQFGVSMADCEDLATAVAADDRVRSGVKSKPFAYNPHKGLFHVVTAVPRTDSQKFGGFGHWPRAMAAPAAYGYDLHDISAAAGMRTTFSGVRGKDETAAGARFGSTYERYGGLFSRLGRGLSEIATGAAEETGIPTGPGWTREVGRGLGRTFVEREPTEDLSSEDASSSDEDEESFGHRIAFMPAGSLDDLAEAAVAEVFGFDS